MSRKRAVGTVLLTSLFLCTPMAMAKKKKSAPSKDFQPEAAPTGGPPSKVLERALKLYDAEDYANASIELNKVVEGQSGDDEANKQRAEFFMGKTLFNMKYYSASLSYFDRIVQKGPNAPLLPEDAAVAGVAVALPAGVGGRAREDRQVHQRDLDQPALEPVRDELYYLLGRYHYQKGNFKDAIELFSSVPEKSEFYPKAKFLEGLTHVREYHGKIAADSFKAILRKVKQYDDPDKVPKALKEAEELANLSLGRVFYSTKQYDRSRSSTSRSCPAPMRATARRRTGARRCSRRRGPTSEATATPRRSATSTRSRRRSSRPEFYPEAYILKAVIYFNRCNYDRSAGSHQRVQRHLSRSPQRDRRHPRQVSRQRAVLRLRRQDPDRRGRPLRARENAAAGALPTARCRRTSSASTSSTASSRRSTRPTRRGSRRRSPATSCRI